MKDDFLLAFSTYNQQELLDTNDYVCRFGLSLTSEDVDMLLLRRRKCLSEQQRVEFGGGVLQKLIYAFCDSVYIRQDNYADTLASLQDIFYLYKNESMDILTDDELIELMREAFDGECEGSLEYLEETCLEQIARAIRGGSYN